MRVTAKSLRTLLPVLLTSSALAFGCGDDDKGDAAVNPDGSVAHVDAGTHLDAAVGIDSSIGTPGGDSGLLADGGGVSLTDSQIVAITAAVNSGEIAQGQLASTKAQRTSVQEFAQLMVTHHTQANSAQATLLPTLGLTPAESAVSVMLEGDATTALTKLQNTAAGPAFDLQYVQAQVQQHQLVLDLLDDELIPDARSEALKAALSTTRTMVASHLSAAKALLSTLLGDAGVQDAG